MPRPRNFRPYPGSLTSENMSGNVVDVFYVPSRERIEESGLGTSSCDPEQYRVHLLHLDGNAGSLTMYPTQTSRPNAAFLEPLYTRVRRITLMSSRLVRVDFSLCYPSSQEDIMSLLDRLPACFVRGYNFGLGFRQDFYPIVEVVEELSSCSELLVSDDGETHVDASGDVFCLSYADFQAMLTAIRKTVRGSTSRGRSYNVGMLSDFLSARLQEPQGSGRRPSRSVGLEPLPADRDSMSPHDRDQALSLIAGNVRAIAESQPDQFVDFSRKFDLARLDALIEEYGRMMRRRTREVEWQRFFERYKFVLSQALGSPIAFVQREPSVGGAKLDGSGGKVGDFLYRNSRTNNSVLIELKTPRTKLLNTGSVRGGVYGPSGDLTGGMTQVLDQRYLLLAEFESKKLRSRVYDIESYAVRCCLVIGTLPEDEDMKKSFELFRGNSKDVEILTFDELLEKLNMVKEFLAMLDAE